MEISPAEDVTITCNVQKDESLASLKLHFTKMADAGEIKVVADNIFGEVASACRLTINCKSCLYFRSCRKIVFKYTVAFLCIKVYLMISFSLVVFKLILHHVVLIRVLDHTK